MAEGNRGLKPKYLILILVAVIGVIGSMTQGLIPFLIGLVVKPPADTVATKTNLHVVAPGQQENVLPVVSIISDPKCDSPGLSYGKIEFINKLDQDIVVDGIRSSSNFLRPGSKIGVGRNWETPKLKMGKPVGTSSTDYTFHFSTVAQESHKKLLGKMIVSVEQCRSKKIIIDLRSIDLKPL